MLIEYLSIISLIRINQKAILEVDKVSDLIIRADHITKDYPGTRALDDISISFDSGKVNALVGKNGSGKSTLVKIFAGAVKPTSGDILSQ